MPTRDCCSASCVPKRLSHGQRSHTSGVRRPCRCPPVEDSARSLRSLLSPLRPPPKPRSPEAPQKQLLQLNGLLADFSSGWMASLPSRRKQPTWNYPSVVIERRCSFHVLYMADNRDREKPCGSPLPHHRTNGSRYRHRPCLILRWQRNSRGRWVHCPRCSRGRPCRAVAPSS